MNVLFTNAGRRTYLIEYALELIDQGYDINIYVCDVSEDTAAMHVDDRVNWFLTPRVSDDEEKYFKILKEKCEHYQIDVLIPLMDFELPIIAKNKKQLEDQGVKVWVSDYLVIQNCLNKEKNYNYCLEHDIKIPESYFEKVEFYPAIKKKIYGSGSIGLEYIESEVAQFKFVEGEDMLQECIDGQEYGMDVFNDYEGNYVHSSVREKLAMRSGETDKARTFRSGKYEQLARDISAAFGHVGNMDIDFILTKEGEIFFIDFNPRFGGGYPFTHQSGANYLKYIIDVSKEKQNISRPTFKKGITGYKGLKLFVNYNN